MPIKSHEQNREFQKINENEKKIIEGSISKISPKISMFLKKLQQHFYISFKNLDSKKDYPTIHLVPSNLTEIMNTVTPMLNANIISAGLYFGFIKNNQFFLSLEGAEYLFKEGVFLENNLMQVNEDGEKSILYGNNVLKTMIAKISPSVKKNDFLLVFNQKSELIAIARSQLDYFSIENLNPKAIVALNLIDKGYYLRKKQ